MALWLEPPENEQIVEDELRKASMFPTVENPVVDLEGFIERHLGVKKLDLTADLPPTVLGVTEFFSGKPPEVSINRNLTGAMEVDEDGEDGSLGRWRATLAHEGFHVLVHRPLFEVSAAQFDLLARAPAAPRQLMRCLKRDVMFRAGGSAWHEVQANRGMAAMLMPAAVFRAVVEHEQAAVSPVIGFDGSIVTDLLVRNVAKRFQVSRQAARIRLQTLGISLDTKQLHLSTA